MPLEGPIQVIATTISGSIKDWGKVARIVPLFAAQGRQQVTLEAVTSHAAARLATQAALRAGTRIIISAGGSGTFNAVLEGCLDSGVPLAEVTLGFLRKGSADLIGKVLAMPDEIEAAIAAFVEALTSERRVPCDVLQVLGGPAQARPRHFVGYGGLEIFGRIPHYTENRFIKYYKGVLSQLFGDLGPFFVGACLASSEKVLTRPWRGRPEWVIESDGQELAHGPYVAMILVNGDLGRDLPLARGEPLGSGHFHLFALRDLGLRRLPGQFKHTWDASILAEAERWGCETYRIPGTLRLWRRDQRPFDLNTDGSTLICQPHASIRIVNQVHLLAAPGHL